MVLALIGTPTGPAAAEAATSLVVAPFNPAVAAGAFTGGPAVDHLSTPAATVPAGVSGRGERPVPAPPSGRRRVRATLTPGAAP